MTWPIQHLTAEDLDAFHSASLNPPAAKHVQECQECRALLEQDRVLVEALESLPLFDASADFADRVLERVGTPAPALARQVPLPRRLALAASVLVAMGGSAGWALFNRGLLLSWIDGLAAGAGRALWMTVATVADNLADLARVSPVPDLASSPGRLALVGTVLLIGYAAAMVALRRLLLLPGQPASHANG